MVKESNLETHIELCALRYEGIEKKFNEMEKRFTKIEEGLEDIKTILGENKSKNFATVVTTAGTIIVALIGMLGYLILKT